MKCPACYFNNRKGAIECASCGAAMFVKDRKQQPIYDQSFERTQKEIALFTARHEQKRYRLSPQDSAETDESFCNRINIEKTPYVLREHQLMVTGHEIQIAREPGSDDEPTGHPQR